MHPALLPVIAASALTACTPVDNGSDSGVSGDAAPLVWGPQSAEDMDPDPDVVEVHLRAGLATATWVGPEDPSEVWAYNGQVPGPLIELTEGQTLRVVLDNELPDDTPTTIHWHGLRISDLMDGMPHIQDPVEAGEQFVYEFTPPDAGTYWYHPHVRSYEQVERGLHGALIVHEADAPQVAMDRMFVLDDVYLRSGGAMYPFNLSHMEQMHGRHGNMLLANGQPITGENAEALKDSVQSGASERWRIVNTANARTMYADVTGARWRVIAVDGTLLPEPYETERVLLPVGRRFDLEVIPDAAESDAVALRVLLPDGAAFADYPVFSGTVEGDAAPGDWLDWNAAALPAIAGDPDQEVALTFDNQAGESGDIDWTINGVTWDDHDDIIVAGNTPTTLRLTENSGAEHPFHLHGQFFQVVEIDGEPPGPELSGLMDTVLLDPGTETVLYTDFDNPGRWMAHCHILAHAELGMMTQLVVE